MDLKLSGERIKEMRQKAGLTQTQLATALSDGQKTDRGKSTISEYEHGKNLTLSNLQKMADVLKCDVEYLLGCQDHPDATTSLIAEQIPLSREAISKLIMLNEALDTKDPNFRESFNMIAGIIDTLIIELIPKYVSPNEVRDSTARKGSALFNYTYRYLKAVEYLKAHGINLDKNHKVSIHDIARKSKMRGTIEAVEVENAQLSMDANAIKIGSVLGDIVAEYLKTLGTEEA